jgi:ATP-dependent Clp protease protease subunit
MWFFGPRKQPASQPMPTASAEQLLQQRVVLLRGEIDDEQAKLVIAQLLFLQDQDAQQPITLIISSPGGSVPAGMAIVETIKDLSPPVRTRCEGSANGMAAIILAWGQRGERVVVRGNSLSLTPLTIAAGGSRADLDRIQRLLAGVVAERSKRGVEAVAKDLTAGRSFDPEAAVEYGLADRVVE